MSGLAAPNRWVAVGLTLVTGCALAVQLEACIGDLPPIFARDASTDAVAVDGDADGSPTDSSGTDATDGSSSVDAGPAASCDDAGGPGLGSCGPDGGAESCCASLLVPGGSFQRSNTTPATVSSFRLDRYEVTVARFRKFVDAVVGGWTPGEGKGKHAHLNGGQGLAFAPNDAGLAYEPGWEGAKYGVLSTSPATWTTNLSCGNAGQTWTASAGPNESLPITCVNWIEAFAFCIWDNGFLPSEAEWNYAAAGGSDQRDLPWGASPADCSRTNYGGQCGGKPIRPGSVSPAGDGKWGHADLVGNVWEWVLDWNGVYPTPCSDCALLAGTTDRGQRGAGFEDNPPQLTTSYRGGLAPTSRWHADGFRCARSP